MIHVAEPQLLGREAEYVTDCLTRGQLSAGPYVDRFEGLLAQTCRSPFAAACCNGTAALHLALLALDLQPGDEVLVPNLTYVATANAVRYCGATPVPCDVDPLTWMINAETALACATDRTVGLIAVHLYGHIADLPALDALAQAHGWWIVEDAAEAIGAEWHGQPIGSFGHLATLSFYGNKIITCGEGGAVLSPTKELDARVRLFRGQGVDRPGSYDHQVVGYNYRMGDLQAAVGLGQLEQLWHHLDAHRTVACQYRVWASRAQLDYQIAIRGTDPADWMFTFLVPEGVARDDVAARLYAAGVQTRPAFPLLTSLPMYRTSPYPSGAGFYPVAEEVSARGLTLPTHAGLTEHDVEHVCQATEFALAGAVA